MKELIRVSMRVMSVYFFIQFILSLIQILFALFTIKNSILNSLFPIFITLLVGLIAFMLWSKAEYFSNKIIGTNSSDNIIINVDNIYLIERLAFTIIGLLTLINGLAPFISKITIEIINSRNNELNIRPIHDFQSLLVYIIQILIGTYLTLGNKGLQNFLKNIRGVKS